MAAKTYRVTRRSYINEQICEPGDIVSLPYGVEPGTALEEVGAKEVKATNEAATEAVKPWTEQEQDRSPAFSTHPAHEQHPKVVLAPELPPEQKKAIDEQTERAAAAATAGQVTVTGPAASVKVDASANKPTRR